MNTFTQESLWTKIRNADIGAEVVIPSTVSLASVMNDGRAPQTVRKAVSNVIGRIAGQHPDTPVGFLHFKAFRTEGNNVRVFAYVDVAQDKEECVGQFQLNTDSNGAIDAVGVLHEDAEVALQDLAPTTTHELCKRFAHDHGYIGSFQAMDDLLRLGSASSVVIQRVLNCIGYWMQANPDYPLNELLYGFEYKNEMTMTLLVHRQDTSACIGAMEWVFNVDGKIQSALEINVDQFGNQVE